MKLQTLGGLQLAGTGFTGQKLLLLLAYLAIEGAKPRRYLAELFFMDNKDPLNNLSRALSDLRKIASGIIEADHKRVWTPLECDATELIKSVESQHFETCLTLYQGAFAEDLTMEMGTELEEWVYSTREILAAKARTAFLTLGEAEAGHGNFSQAALLAEKAYKLREAAELEPDDYARLYNLLYAGSSPLAAEVRKEAESFEIPLELSREQAKAHFSEKVEIVYDIPNNLPPAKTSFVGRDQELIEIAQQLAKPECRLLTLHGMGGIGKSRTATEVAYHQLRVARGSSPSFADGIFFIALDALSSADMIPSAVAESLDLDMQGLDDVFTQVRAFIGKKKLLLILDNFEHLMAGATLVSDLLAACPDVKIMVTSREVLKLEEEWVKDLEGLQYPPSTGVTLEEAQHYEAIRLFSQRAKRAVLEFSPHEDTIANIIEICQLVEGAPLALELAATWVRVMTLSEIAKEIKSNLSFLENQSRNRTERHQSIRAVFEHSWKLLTPKEQDVFRKLSVFVGSFSRQGAAEVTGATLPVLVSLVDKSLLRVMHNGRYSRHFLIYEFSQEKLKETPDEFTQTRQHHATYYCNFLSSQSEAILGAEQKGVLEQLDFEIDNIYAAWPQFFESKDSEQLRQAINTLGEFLSMKGRAKEGINIFSSALNLVKNHKDSDTVILATLNKRIGTLYREMGNLGRARHYAEKSLSLLENLSYTVERGPILRALAIISRKQGDLLKAKTLYQTELEIYKSENNLRALGLTLNNLGLLCGQMGQYMEAKNCIVESIEIARQLESLGGLVANLDSLATLYLLINKPVEAEVALRESLDIAQNIDYVWYVPFLLNSLSRASHQQGKQEQANHYLHEALRQAKNTKNEAALISILTTFAIIKIDTNDLLQVENYLIRALEIGRTLEDKSEIFFCLLEVVKYLIKQGRIELALHLATFIINTSFAWKAVRDYAQELLALYNSTAKPSAFPDLQFLNPSTELERLVIEILQEVPNAVASTN
jgi:predicted ATPase